MTIKQNKFIFAKENDCDFVFVTKKTGFYIETACMRKIMLLQDIDRRNMRVKNCCDAKACESYYLSQVGLGMIYFAGTRVQHSYGLDICLVPLLKAFYL